MDEKISEQRKNISTNYSLNMSSQNIYHYSSLNQIIIGTYNNNMNCVFPYSLRIILLYLYDIKQPLLLDIKHQSINQLNAILN